MPTGHRVFKGTHFAYFVTCTTVNWLPVFEKPAYCNVVLNSLAAIRDKKRTQLNAFVIMPTHIHAILWPEPEISLSNVLRDFKRFTSRSISRLAEQAQDSVFLDVFSRARLENRAQEVSRYQVWQEGSHPEALYSPAFARQKMDYIHMNPVRAGLASSAVEWPYTSARAYYLLQRTFPPIDLLYLG